ncbi:MAG TPA: hypothetical protein VN027_18250 [Isoptericola sp.]|nr:hypothetical protein [Isoptericola sp.]
MTWSDGRSRWLISAGCGVAGLAALAGCAGGPGASPASTGEELFAERAPLPSCGEVTARPDLGEGEPKAELAEAYACLDAAASGEGAELVVRSLTVEGDPIVEYWRTGPGIDGLEVYSDNTQDTYGDQVWRHRVCPGTATVAEPEDCEEWALVEG